ncbi:deoxyribose-phosphate aldolase [Treponema sp. OMZ 840]|uniref:deoxyribose-phosphate aldolase n=1 Tax=Treponema sp. OMZ 840 TaxID=244313 RepID=UPI003D8BB93F
MTKSSIAKMIDHTLLKPDAKEDAIIKLCSEAKEYSFYSVCVNSTWVKLCAKELSNSLVKVCTVVGFPLGAVSTFGKEYETKKAIEDGAQEVDMVLNIGALKSKLYKKASEDIHSIVKICNGKILTKVILEMCLLTEEEKKLAIQICIDEGADFVKTSTGFSSGGATVEDVKLMRMMVGTKLGVKASGGIRSRADAERMIAAGASRLGTSSGILILTKE